MRTLLGCSLAAVLVISAGTRADDKKDTPIDEKKLIGKWQPKEAGKEGRYVVEFVAGGKIVFTSTADDKEGRIEGTYKLDGTKLITRVTVKGMERVEETTITKLTDEELATEDTKGGKQTFLRVRGK